LSPKLTIVKKSTNHHLESPDSYLPTVMTCQNYLKVPDYSSYEIFKQRFTTAINEGLNAFHLS
jgi:E3 ubiquitin-protein ligase TRIP12